MRFKMEQTGVKEHPELAVLDNCHVLNPVTSVRRRAVCVLIKIIKSIIQEHML